MRSTVDRLCYAYSSCYHYSIKNLFVWSNKFLNGGNLFKTPFNWIFGKIYFLKNCWCEFYFCRREIDYATLASAFFCRREIIWVRKSASDTNKLTLLFRSSQVLVDSEEYFLRKLILLEEIFSKQTNLQF